MVQLAAADGVEFVFHLGGELVIDQVGQMRFEQVRHGKRRPGGNQHVAALRLKHVFAGKDRVDDRGICARPADAHFFQRPGKRGFAVSIRRLGGVALQFQILATERFAHGHLRQHHVAVGDIGFGIVGSFDIRPQIAGKFDGLAARLEHRPVDFHRDRGAEAPGVGHLAGNGPLPNQVVEFELIGAEFVPQRLGKIEVVTGRPDGLVGLLGVFHLGLINSRLRRQILMAVLRCHQRPGRLDGHRRQTGRVGSHVGDMAGFVQALRHLHGVPGGKSVFAVGFLLKRAGRKRRIRPGSIGLCFQVGYFGRSAAKPLEQLLGPFFVEQQQCRIFDQAGGGIEIAALGNFPPVDRDQFRLKTFAAGFGEHAQQIPIGGGLEGHPLPLAFDNQSHGHALHPARRKPRPNLPPQQAAIRRSRRAGR